MPERYVAVNGTTLFLDLRGDPGTPPLLYLHGGPGMSCHEFMAWQGDLIARRRFLVGMDQRGVLRSDPLDGTLTEQLLVDDCEAVREALRIPRWTVLGHSFGGRVALRYACAHPGRVDTVIFENPCWDFDDTERRRLPAAAAIFDELGDHGSAQECRRLAARPERITDWRETAPLIGRLVDHDRYDDLYFHQPAARARWQATEAAARFPDELRARGRAHAEQALDGCAESLVPLLRRLETAAVLIKGGHDLVAGPAQVEAFRPHGAVLELPDAGHFVQLEEPEAYADAVSR
ncbi:alpha/beta fold hydrolase [Actinophytocola sp.]|uniref:alpha/beta fold hydrolase n=1 Tax=Actinophytocola sp. TaxID=1872138 RepID=UPI0025BEFAD7|nr:alpha/beta hydrolase [Actinophytocola sp.]